MRNLHIAFLFALVGTMYATKDKNALSNELIVRPSREVKEVSIKTPQKELLSLEKLPKKEKYTVGKFVQQFNKNQLLLLPIFLTSYIALTFPNSCNLVPNQDNVEFNQAALKFNMEAKRLSAKTGDGSFYESRIQLRDEFECESHALMVLKWSASALTLWYLCHYDLDKEVCDFFSKENFKRSCLTTLALCGSYQTMFFVASLCEEGSPYGVGCMVGIYALLCSFYNVYKMRSHFA